MTTNKPEVVAEVHGHLYSLIIDWKTPTLDSMCRAGDQLIRLSDYEALQAECDALVEALVEISDPIRFMKERLEEGERLNGMAAVQLAEDASYLRGIARAALVAHRKGANP